MSPYRGQEMAYETPIDERGLTGFLFGICCEAFLYLLGPIFYALFLFEVLGKKLEPNFDCYANIHYDYAIPGVMNISDGDWMNVSYLYRVVLITGLAVSLFNLLILLPLRACFGLQYYNRKDRTPKGDLQESLNTPQNSVSNVIGLLFTSLGIFIIVVRFSHHGRVCAGDFLADLEKENDVVRTFYDIDTGLFLFILAIL